MAIQAKELTKDYQYGFSDIDVSVFRTAKGLSPEVVASISQHKNEPEWMLKFRLKALDHFRKRPMPDVGRGSFGSRLREHLLLRQARRGDEPLVGRRPRTRSSRPSTGSASRRRSASSSPE